MAKISKLAEMMAVGNPVPEVLCVFLQITNILHHLIFPTMGWVSWKLVGRAPTIKRGLVPHQLVEYIASYVHRGPTLEYRVTNYVSRATSYIQLCTYQHSSPLFLLYVQYCTVQYCNRSLFGRVLRKMGSVLNLIPVRGIAGDVVGCHHPMKFQTLRNLSWGKAGT